MLAASRIPELDVRWPIIDFTPIIASSATFQVHPVKKNPHLACDRNTSHPNLRRGNFHLSNSSHGAFLIIPVEACGKMGTDRLPRAATMFSLIALNAHLWMSASTTSYNVHIQAPSLLHCLWWAQNQRHRNWGNKVALGQCQQSGTWQQGPEIMPQRILFYSCNVDNDI